MLLLLFSQYITVFESPNIILLTILFYIHDIAALFKMFQLRSIVICSKPRSFLDNVFDLLLVLIPWLSHQSLS